MTSPAPPESITMTSRVPLEILVTITTFIVDPITLFELRLVSQAWSFAATIQLKSVAYISMDQATHNRLDTQISDERSRNAICSVVMNVPDRDYWTVRGPNDRILATHISFVAHRSLATILETCVPKFPNIRHLSLHFRPPPRALAPFASSTKYKAIFLCYLMRSLFNSLAALRGLQELALHSLPIQANLPMIGPPDSFTQMRLITIIRNLKLRSLKLGFVGFNVWPPHDPQHEVHTTSLGYQSFDPPGIWIYHTKDTLRHLSLTCWGFYMSDIPTACDCIEHCIPHLESLELGGIGFTNDNQLQWILNHHETLRSIVLQDCAIVYSMEVNDSFEPDNSFDTSKIVERNDQKYHVYCTRWHHWFEKFETELPNLTNFKFGSRRVRAPGEGGPEFVSESFSGPPFERPAKFLFGLFPDRYIAMADGEDLCPWVLRPPTLIHPPVPRVSRYDQRALRALMEEISQDFKETDTSDHAAFVQDLTGYMKPVGENNEGENNEEENDKEENEEEENEEEEEEKEAEKEEEKEDEKEEKTR